MSSGKRSVAQNMPFEGNSIDSRKPLEGKCFGSMPFPDWFVAGNFFSISRNTESSMSTLLIQNGTLATLGENNRILTDHSLLVENELIKKIAPTEEMRDQTADTVIDAKGQLVLPGFINAHTHFYSAFSRGLGKVPPSKNFVEVLENLWWRLDRLLTPEDCYYSALVSCIDAVKHGTTTLIDHHASEGHVRGTLELIEKAVLETGLRGSLCFELTDRDGPQVAQDGIDENVEFIRAKKRDQSSRIKALFGLHAAFTINNDTLEKAVAAARELDVGFHIHTAEDQADQDHSLKTHGIRVVERLHKFGVLGPQTICAHCIHVDEAEMDLLAETDTIGMHLPQSNLNNAVGVADVVKLIDKGILYGLGTDSMTNNLLEEARVALWAQHISKSNPSVGFMEVWNALLVNNSKILSRYWDENIGTLEEGSLADIVLMDYYPPTPFDENSFIGHMCFGVAHSSARTTIASGKVLMRDHQLIGIDEERIAARARELSQALWDRF